MSIVTKTGDQGTTSLWSGERVRKDDPRVEAYGTIDELSSFIGQARHCVKRTETAELLLRVQRDLFRVAAELATVGRAYPDAIRDEDADAMGDRIASFEAELHLTGFVVQGNTPQSATLDVARAVARRAERRIIALADTDSVSMPLRRYVNRLSDLLFILGRWEEAGEGKILYK